MNYMLFMIDVYWLEHTKLYNLRAYEKLTILMTNMMRTCVHNPLNINADFLAILNQTLQNYWKILKKYLIGTTWIVIYYQHVDVCVTKGFIVIYHILYFFCYACLSFHIIKLSTYHRHLVVLNTFFFKISLKF